MRVVSTVAIVIALLAALCAPSAAAEATPPAGTHTGSTAGADARAALSHRVSCTRDAAHRVTGVALARPRVRMEPRWSKRGWSEQIVTLYLVLQGQDPHTGVWSVVTDHKVTPTTVHRGRAARLRAKRFSSLPTSGYAAFRVRAVVSWRNPNTYGTDKTRRYVSASCVNPPEPVPAPPPDAVAPAAPTWGVAGGSFENSLAWATLGDAVSVRRTDLRYDGQAAIEVSTASGGGSAYLDEPYSWANGQLVATVWLRSLTGTASGSLTLWGTGGGSNEGNSTPYTVGTTWTPVQVVMDFTTNHTALRLQLYPRAGAAGDVLADGAHVSATWVTDGSFEHGDTWSWSHGNGGGTTNVVHYTGQSGHDGGGFLAFNTTEGGYVADTLAAAPTIGEETVATAWVRAQSGSASGRVCLVATGTTNDETVCEPYATGTGWHEVQIGLVPRRSHSSVRIEVRPGGGTTWLDTVSAVQWATFDGGLENGSRWVGTGSARVAAVRGGLAHDGSVYLQVTGITGAAQRTVAATVPTAVGTPLQVWLRATSGTASGQLCLLATGQTSTESNCTPYSVGTGYTPVSVVLDTRGAHDHLVAQIRPTRGTVLADTVSSVG